MSMHSFFLKKKKKEFICWKKIEQLLTTKLSNVKMQESNVWFILDYKYTQTHRLGLSLSSFDISISSLMICSKFSLSHLHGWAKGGSSHRNFYLEALLELQFILFFSNGPIEMTCCKQFFGFFFFERHPI